MSQLERKHPLDFLNSYSIGLKLKTLRTSRHFTLARLSVETGLSCALLSKLETDRMIPTLHTLARLSQVYGVGLSHFFFDSKRRSVAITRKLNVTDHSRSVPSTTRILLHHPEPHGQLSTTLLELPPGAPFSVGEIGSPTELFAYVLEGRLQITIAGSNEVLDAGDCAALDTDAAAVWCALDGTHCRVLTVTPRTSPIGKETADG